MKRILCLLLCLLPVTVMAQGILDRFTDPEKGKTTFIPKGNWAIGITGGYRSFTAGGTSAGSGYSILSFLNIGDGKLAMYEATPSFSYFIADDLSLGVRLDYDGYLLDTDLRANLGELFNFSGIIDIIDSQSNPEDADALTADDLYEMLNVRISGRHMVSNSWGTSLALRKYLSFFGSKIFAIFGEARLYGKYGLVYSCPINSEGAYNLERMRTSNIYSAGLKLAGGLCVKLRDNSAFTISVPLVGASYYYTTQYKETKSGPTSAKVSQFSLSRELDYLAIQVGYVHYIEPKKRK